VALSVRNLFFLQWIAAPPLLSTASGFSPWITSVQLLKPQVSYLDKNVSVPHGKAN
jgi:hypothetical protein